MSSNSLVTDGNDKGVATGDFASRFSAHDFVEETVRAADIVVKSERRMMREPHILLATTGQLPSTARLAMELRDAGARVGLIAPSKHPAWTLDLFAYRLLERGTPEECGHRETPGAGPGRRLGPAAPRRGRAPRVDHDWSLLPMVGRKTTNHCDAGPAIERW